jgi:hypothetical protein
VAGEQYYVGNEYLHALAQEFQAAADRFASLTPRFQGNALVDAEAFGLLGACTGAFTQYQQLVDHTVHGLGELEKALTGDAAGLENTAEHYQQVEEHNSALFGGK